MEVLKKDGQIIAARPETLEELRVLEILIAAARAHALARGVNPSETMGRATLRCDCCDAAFAGGYSYAECRELAQKEGWAVNLAKKRYPAGADYCPKCKGKA